MYIFLSILIVIASLLLIGAVLIQKSKGGGLASNYASGNQIMGYRKTTDFIEKATWGLAIFICVCSIAASFTVPHAVNKSSIEQTQAPVNTNTEAPAAKKEVAPAQAAPAAKPEAPKAN
ncbi:MAG: preprotein translocase subunit SecG [Muribaculaceae bacterium]|nr:preprotein translocase subunit SecG [Muribaculaceae bacterium]